MSGTLDSIDLRGQEFSYRPVPPLAVITGVTAALSLFGIVTEFALPLAVLGCIFGVLSLKTFKRYAGEYSGQWVAKSGFLVSAFVLLGGSVLHAFTYAREVPEGYLRVSFTNDIAKKGFPFENGRENYHEDVKPLDSQKVFVKGYMYPTGQMEGIRSFILCRDSGDCCFGGQPKLTDMIQVVLKDDARGANFYSGLVSVAGVFHLKDLRRVSSVSPAYEIEATQVAVAKKLY